MNIKRLKNPEQLMKHIFGMEHEYVFVKDGVKQIDKGLHHLYQWWAERDGLALIRNKRIHPKTGIIKAEVFMNEKWVKKTFFSANWSPKKVVDKIAESINNVKGCPPLSKGSWRLEAYTDCGVKIRTIIKKNGTGVTSYPIWE